ncbi:MAG: hypothetical protein ABIC39_01240, partial [Pseudomonadota bacterium]
IIMILGTDSHEARVVIKFENVDAPVYKDGRIKIRPDEMKKGDWGALFCEAVRVAQNYGGMILKGQDCYNWMEGIALYCRFLLDEDFDIFKGEGADFLKEARFFCAG